MASSRRRFLTTLTTAAAGSAALGGRAAAWNGVAVRPVAPDSLSPAELLERQLSQPVAAAAPGAAAAAQADPRMPTPEEVRSWYTDRRNWGRWGDDDEKGAINLITDEKSAAATRLVRTGRKVSASRVFEPSQQFIRKSPREGGGGAVSDYYGFIYHGQTVTHIDALCHMWESDGMWGAATPTWR